MLEDCDAFVQSIEEKSSLYSTSSIATGQFLNV